MKKFLVYVLIASTLIGSFLPFFAPKKAEASAPLIAAIFPPDATTVGFDDPQYGQGLYEGNSPLGVGPIHNKYITNEVTLTDTKIGSDYADFTFGLDMGNDPNQQAVTDTNSNNIFGDIEEELGEWAAFYDPNSTGIPLKSNNAFPGTSGIYLEIGTGTTPDGTAPPYSPLITGIKDVTGSDTGIALDPYIDFKLTTQIGLKSLHVALLQPSTTYYARISFYQRGVQSGYAIGHSKIVKFTTLTAGDDTSATTGITATDTGTGVAQTNNTGSLPWCTRAPFSINMLGCFTQIFFYVLYVPSAALARLAAGFLDWFLNFSIQSTSYTGSQFVPQGWGIVRDISNIVFIFILLYIAIGTILRINGIDAKKMVASLVVIALLINFSLFFTKVIIDTSNILARVIYDSVTVTGANSHTNTGEKSITVGLVSKFNPQKIFQTNQLNANTHTGWFFFVLVIAILLNIFMFLMFLKVAVLFVGRVIGLMVSMIFSPFAFISWIVPSMRSWQKVGWNHWWHELVSQAFLAPIFLFFIYLVLMFSNVDVLPGDSTDPIVGLIAIIVPFAIIYFLIKTASDMAIKLSGDIGAASMAVMNKVGGAAVGVATGGAALALRSTAGAAAGNAAKNQELQAKAAAGDRMAKLKLGMYNSLGASSFDFKKTKAGEGFAKGTGWDTKASAPFGSFAQGAVNLGFGKGRFDFSTEGGAKGATERKKEARMKEAETYKMTGYEADQQNKAAKDWQEKFEADRENTRAAIEASGGIFKEADFKRLYEKQMATTYDKDGNIINNANGGRTKIQSAAEVNAERMRDQADSIEYGPAYIASKKAAKTVNDQLIAQQIAAGVAVKDRALPFNEEKWRQAQGITARNLNATEQATISALRKQAGEETKDMQKPISVTERRRAEQSLNKTAREMQEIDHSLKDIADNIEFQTGVRPAKVDESHIKQVVEYRQKDLETAQLNLAKAEASKNPLEIAKNRMNIKKAEEDIKMYKEVFTKKDAAELKIRDANDKLNS